MSFLHAVKGLAITRKLCFKIPGITFVVRILSLHFSYAGSFLRLRIVTGLIVQAL